MAPLISLDTNVLVRLLVDDDGQADQCNRARLAVSRYERAFVSQVVQAETIWVLKRAYKFSRDEIADVLEHLLGNRAFELEDANLLKSALAVYRSSKIDFSDALVLQASRRKGLDLLTFDAKISRLPNTIEPN